MSDTAFKPSPLLDATEVAAVHALSRMADGVQFSDGDSIPFVVLPQDTGYQIGSLEHLLTAPRRPRGNVTLGAFQSFLDYLRDRAEHVPPVFWTEVTAGVRFESILNYDGWRDSRAAYVSTYSPRWARWMGKNRVAMGQADFAQFIEDNALDVIEPDSATMIEVSRSIEARKKVNFASGIRLNNGQSELTYEETIEGTAGKGKLAIPEQFTIAIPVFVDGDPWKVTARLRYRINEGKLSLWYDLLRFTDVAEAAVTGMVKQLKETIPCDVYRGVCEAINPIR